MVNRLSRYRIKYRYLPMKSFLKVQKGTGDEFVKSFSVFWSWEIESLDKCLSYFIQSNFVQALTSTPLISNHVKQTCYVQLLSNF